MRFQQRAKQSRVSIRNVGVAEVDVAHWQLLHERHFQCRFDLVCSWFLRWLWRTSFSGCWLGGLLFFYFWCDCVGCDSAFEWQAVSL